MDQPCTAPNYLGMATFEKGDLVVFKAKMRLLCGTIHGVGKLCYNITGPYGDYKISFNSVFCAFREILFGLCNLEHLLLGEGWLRDMTTRQFCALYQLKERSLPQASRGILTHQQKLEVCIRYTESLGQKFLMPVNLKEEVNEFWDEIRSRYEVDLRDEKKLNDTVQDTDFLVDICLSIDAERNRKELIQDEINDKLKKAKRRRARELRRLCKLRQAESKKDQAIQDTNVGMVSHKSSDCAMNRGDEPAAHIEFDTLFSQIMGDIGATYSCSDDSQVCDCGSDGNVEAQDPAEVLLTAFVTILFKSQKLRDEIILKIRSSGHTIHSLARLAYPQLDRELELAGLQGPEMAEPRMLIMSDLIPWYKFTCGDWSVCS